MNFSLYSNFFLSSLFFVSFLMFYPYVWKFRIFFFSPCYCFVYNDFFFFFLLFSFLCLAFSNFIHLYIHCRSLLLTTITFLTVRCWFVCVCIVCCVCLFFFLYSFIWSLLSVFCCHSVQKQCKKTDRDSQSVYFLFLSVSFSSKFKCSKNSDLSLSKVTSEYLINDVWLLHLPIFFSSS